MRTMFAVAALAALLVAALPQAAAAVPADAADAQAMACAASAPPCGYIVPSITLDFPEKPPCRAKTLGGPVDLSACIPLPAVGESTVQEGMLRFSWDVTQDGDYPPDPACAAPGTPCITVTLTGTATNPKWMKLSVEPAEYVLDSVAFVNPQNFKTEGQGQGTKVIFLIEVPITVTFARVDVGDDDKSEQRIERGQGVTQMFLKAKSSASGQYFKEAFGVEEFRFNTCANDDALRARIKQCDGVQTTQGETPAVDDAAPAEDAPAFGFLAPVAVLGLLAVALRRRRA